MLRTTRREILLASASALVVSGVSPGKKLKVVVTGGHPGDPEYGCGGTVARYTDLGHEVTFVYLNRGEKGCAGKPQTECGAIRTSEAQKACSILKAQSAFARQIDGEASVNAAAYDEFRHLIESLKPDICSPTGRWMDIGTTGLSRHLLTMPGFNRARQRHFITTKFQTVKTH
jgi:hypothetical protein